LKVVWLVSVIVANRRAAILSRRVCGDRKTSAVTYYVIGLRLPSCVI
jgi:hypothetical protein